MRKMKNILDTIFKQIIFLRHRNYVWRGWEESKQHFLVSPMEG